MTTTATPAPVTNACAIRAQDFSRTTTEPLRNEWTLGKLRHVIAALQGVPVVVTVDRQTGHTLIGVRLVRCYDGGNSGPRVTIEQTFTDGTAHRTNFYLPSLGDTIIPLANPAEYRNGGPKWDALHTYREEICAAIRVARALHGEVAGRAWGAWTGQPAAVGVYVRYEPSTGNAAFAEKWGTRWSGLVVGEQVRGV